MRNTLLFLLVVCLVCLAADVITDPDGNILVSTWGRTAVLRHKASMLGPLYVVNYDNPTSAVNKTYVDAATNQVRINSDGRYLPMSGASNMLGVLNMGGFAITNVGAPPTALSAANRQYVDAATNAVDDLTWKSVQIGGSPVTYAGLGYVYGPSFAGSVQLNSFTIPINGVTTCDFRWTIANGSAAIVVSNQCIVRQHFANAAWPETIFIDTIQQTGSALYITQVVHRVVCTGIGVQMMAYNTQTLALGATCQWLRGEYRR